jgi:hypothetical protein
MLTVPDDLRGQSVRCPGCGDVFTAGIDEPAQPTQSPPVEKTSVHENTEAPRRRASARRDEYDDWDDDDYPRRRIRRRLDCEPHRGTMILVFGILSLVVCGLSFIFGPLAWALGASDLRKIRQGLMDPEGEGTTRAGMICGIIATCLAYGGCLFYGVAIFAMGAVRRF